MGGRHGKAKKEDGKKRKKKRKERPKERPPPTREEVLQRTVVQNSSDIDRSTFVKPTTDQPLNQDPNPSSTLSPTIHQSRTLNQMSQISMTSSPTASTTAATSSEPPALPPRMYWRTQAFILISLILKST